MSTDSKGVNHVTCVRTTNGGCILHSAVLCLDVFIRSFLLDQMSPRLVCLDFLLGYTTWKRLNLFLEQLLSTLPYRSRRAVLECQ